MNIVRSARRYCVHRLSTGYHLSCAYAIPGACVGAITRRRVPDFDFKTEAMGLGFGVAPVGPGQWNQSQGSAL